MYRDTAVLEWTKANRVKQNLDKTEILLLQGGTSDRLGRMVSRLDGTLLQFRDQVHNLGVFVDPSLSWESQIAAMSRSPFNQLRLITQLRSYLDEDSLRTLMFPFLFLFYLSRVVLWDTNGSGIQIG